MTSTTSTRPAPRGRPPEALPPSLVAAPAAPERAGSAPSWSRVLVVSVVRLAVGAIQVAPLLGPGSGGRFGAWVLAWILLSAVVVAAIAASITLRQRPGTERRPRRDPLPVEVSVAVGDMIAYALVAVTAPEGYGSVAVLGVMLLAQASLRWHARGTALVGAALAAVTLPNPTPADERMPERVALAGALAAVTVLGMLLGRFLRYRTAVRERTLRTLALVFDHSPAATAITTVTGGLLKTNAAMDRLLGLPRGGPAQGSLTDHVHPDDAVALAAALAAATGTATDGGDRDAAPTPLLLLDPSGSRRVEVLLGVVPAGGGLPTQLVVQVDDVEDRLAATALLEHEALHDPLTGLPNRRALHRALKERLATRRAGGALVLLDLDGFKEVNDRFGHEAGDDLLVVAAERLRGCLRAGDTAARLSGDEMVVLVDRVEGHAGALAAGQRVLDALTGPVGVAGGEVILRASAGVRALEEGDADTRAVLRDADTALYAAKRSGKATVRLSEPVARTGAETGVPAHQRSGTPLGQSFCTGA